MTSGDPRPWNCGPSFAIDGLCANPQTRAYVFRPAEVELQGKEPKLLHHTHPIAIICVGMNHRRESNFFIYIK